MQSIHKKYLFIIIAALVILLFLSIKNHKKNTPIISEVKLYEKKEFLNTITNTDNDSYLQKSNFNDFTLEDVQVSEDRYKSELNEYISRNDPKKLDVELEISNRPSYNSAEPSRLVLSTIISPMSLIYLNDQNEQTNNIQSNKNQNNMYTDTDIGLLYPFVSRNNDLKIE